ncbi:MAG: RHS repeat-associated core domain-containing protein [Halioglobus sp.]
MAEIDAATGQPVRQHIHVNGEPVAQLTTNPADGSVAVQYVHADHLGTPTLLTNQSGQVVADIEATPFGETYIDYAEVTYNRRFPGQYKDEETGLHYNYFRDYDPSTGRYIQSDPIGLNGGLNTYAYVGGNPLKYTDPTGEDVGVTLVVVWALAYCLDAGDYISTPAGNSHGKDIAGDQDQICSSVAYPLNAFDRAKQYSAVHDACYSSNGCSANSWIISALGGTKACNKCNSTAVRNILGF